MNDIQSNWSERFDVPIDSFRVPCSSQCLRGLHHLQRTVSFCMLKWPLNPASISTNSSTRQLTSATVEQISSCKSKAVRRDPADRTSANGPRPSRVLRLLAEGRDERNQDP
eukprot:gnl/TRDRNA2_/TRDRNA2_164973_c0_seq4.p1 gnl/TRDRNA2_/TRDRNA2_164973_c0~~gnl/TRDRNA2_/TRDRNA2_164973_c0_seq4.p1  ORF type:complete len:111 (-),score=5.62 gnl/TRDRNA2_/TRDRNA2_164973_c0_seq4:4-336(-)